MQQHPGGWKENDRHPNNRRQTMTNSKRISTAVYDAMENNMPIKRRKYTLTAKGAHARTRSGLEVIVPDEVADDQKSYHLAVFPVLGLDGKKRQAQLRGDLYGLFTCGTGSMIVSII